jgi:processing peptidase subunit beta
MSLLSLLSLLSLHSPVPNVSAVSALTFPECLCTHLPRMSLPPLRLHTHTHAAIQGTKRRTQTDIELEVENMGGHLNAYTSREQTAYYARVLRGDVGGAVDLLADILQHSTLDAGAMERERGVILREQEEVEKQPEEVVFDHLHAVAYQGHALGRTILGPAENIRRLSRAHLAGYVRSNYVGPRMVLAAAGAVDHEALVALATKAFAAIPAAGRTLGAPAEAARFTGAELRMRDDTAATAHIALAVEGASWTSPDYFALLVAQACIGSWNRGLLAGPQGDGHASGLAQAVSQHSLAQSFQSFNTAYSDTGLFGIYLVADATRDLDDLLYHVQQEWVRLCLRASEGEVARAKMQLKSALLLSLDGTSAIAEDIGRQVLAYGRRLSLPEIYAAIDAVDVRAVRSTATAYLYDRDPAVVALGPVGSLPDYNRIRAATHWLRN